MARARAAVLLPTPQSKRSGCRVESVLGDIGPVRSLVGAEFGVSVIALLSENAVVR